MTDVIFEKTFWRIVSWWRTQNIEFTIFSNFFIWFYLLFYLEFCTKLLLLTKFFHFVRIRRNNNHGLQKKSQLYFQKAPTVFFKQKHQLWNNAGNRDFLYMKYAKIYQNHLLYQNITIKQKEIQQLFFLNVGKKPKRYTLAPINTRPICSVWSKIGTFQRSLVHMKVQP